MAILQVSAPATRHLGKQIQITVLACRSYLWPTRREESYVKKAKILTLHLVGLRLFTMFLLRHPADTLVTDCEYDPTLAKKSYKSADDYTGTNWQSDAGSETGSVVCTIVGLYIDRIISRMAGDYLELSLVGCCSIDTGGSSNGTGNNFLPKVLYTKIN